MKEQCKKLIKEGRDVAITSLNFMSPMKIRRKRENKGGFTGDVVRSTIQNFHIVLKQIPTLISSNKINKLFIWSQKVTLQVLMKHP